MIVEVNIWKSLIFSVTNTSSINPAERDNSTIINQFSPCILLFALLLTLATTHAARLHPERWYQLQWQAQHGGEIEVVLPDKTRCDRVNDEYAIEFDFADKWAEAIAQSLHYALVTGKKAGVVLIVEHEGDERFWVRMNAVIEEYNLPITVWRR